ncbi:MAG: cysteine-rich CWC family protein [Polaromonas sp.]|nr:cysteine-rich CWC family protein [Polaromonas sp.]
MNLTTAELPKSSVCPRCGAGFRCGNVAGVAACWCSRLPHVMPVPSTMPLPAGASCFCPACLKLMTVDRQPIRFPAGE